MIKYILIISYMLSCVIALYAAFQVFKLQAIRGKKITWGTLFGFLFGCFCPILNIASIWAALDEIEEMGCYANCFIEKILRIK